MIFQRAEVQPDELALDDFTRQRTWRELEDRVHRLAHLIRDELGLGPDDHAAVLMGNRIEVPELIVAAILSGIWLTPINRHLASEEIAYVVEDSGAKVVFSDDAFAEVARNAGAPRVIVAGAELDALISRAASKPIGLTGPGGGNMIYTGGTTGRPKGVKRRRVPSVAVALEGARAYGNSVGLDGSGPHLVTGPVYHAAPLMFAVYDLLNGAPMLIMPRWDEKQALDLIVSRKVRHTHLVPTLFVRLLRLTDAERARFDAPELDLVLHGAAPVSRVVKKRMIEWWGPILVEYWGGTEGGVTTLVNSVDWLEHPGTVGRALPSFEVFAVGDDDEPLPSGEAGLLYSRHRSVENFFEYHNAAEMTASAFLDSHSFTLGDVGHVDEDGFVYLADRKSNLIISGGVNVYPVEVEQALEEHPAVADVAVFGIPDEEWGEQVKAAVELRPGHQASPELEKDILAFGRQQLAGYKLPRSIDFEAKLPRLPTGKLLTRQLRDPYWKGAGRRI